MVDVADLSGHHPTLRNLLKALQKPRPPAAQPKDIELLNSSERNLVHTSGYKRKYHALIKEGVD